MKLSYIGTRAKKDSTNKKRYAEAKWKDGDMKAEDIGFIVCNMGLKPSPLGETFRLTCCTFKATPHNCEVIENMI